ncbi:signal transduction histidine kinase [Paenibacillus castaneae]|uniref:sensor histidine kinase n=1 Tax=Paenibacillus castaneae TaxID=474957 RepID=UPI000C9B9D86|nr:HAMP domain-containing sensor histidine kinase [Paenibacillus castaneae]NIK78227.1 signal transduction histidine kinase [Paenibacillus castaneae]
MRTLYIRIVYTFMLISLASMIVALLLTNFYYAEKVRGYNEQKIMNIGQEIRTLYAKTNDIELGEYLTHIANIGFQIYLVDDEMHGIFYGTPFKHQQMDNKYIREVLNGKTYNGIMEEHHLLVVFSLFESSIQNSIGLPLSANGRTYAMFMRPNLEQQFGEVRIIMAVLLGLVFLLSILFIIIASRYIVKPVKNLTAATNKIVSGDYNIEMDVTRRDEIGNLARHFKQMAQSIKQLDEMRQEFVANVSHEFQSPLTSIQGFSQAILDKETSPEEEERYLRVIEKESRRLSSLSKQLLTLAALDKEENVIHLTSFRLDEQIRQVLIATEWQWTEKQLVIDPDLTEIVITADAGLLYQVWFNLITNSIKFSRSGDTISIGIAVDHHIVVTISDTGIGIPENELSHIFERFHKVDSARNRTNAGSGLGLSIVKKIVDRHKGTIEIQSQLGEGTSFIIRLPRM